LQLCFYGLSAVMIWIPLHRRWRFLGLFSYFCILNLAVLASLIEVYRGNKFITWETRPRLQ
jgi:hypothetical protein